MNQLDLKPIHDGLRELSNHELQRQLWLSDGSGGSSVSSFTEAVEQLFTDTGLADSLQAGATGFGAETDAVFRALESALRKVNSRGGPARTIDDPAMTQVRIIANQLLKLLEESGERLKGRVGQN